jgi:hypothetical protein
MFDGSEFLALAYELLQHSGRNEAKLRCAIGRAYYAAFLRTRSYLQGQGFTISRDRPHQDVWDFIDSPRVPVRGAISQGGKRLRDWRNSADYDLIYPSDLSAEAAVAFMTAERLLKDLEALS